MSAHYILMEEAFRQFIHHQKVVGYGFMQQKRVPLPNGYFAFPCGYYTLYENGYKVIISGESLGQTPVQEMMILDPNDVPVARDTEDIREVNW